MKEIRTKFYQTSRDEASEQIRKQFDDYLGLAGSINADDGVQKVLVPPMLGVDEDMRNWSFFMILEHNAIVNRSITTIVESLVLGEDAKDDIDPKTGVMPSANPGEEQIEAFRTSVTHHLEIVSNLSGLRETKTKPHAIFGEFDAHCWHCMFGFHLSIHHQQAAYVVRHLRKA